MVSDGSFNSIFQRAEVFVSMKPGFSFPSYIMPLALYLKSYHQTPGHLGFSPALSPMSFMVLRFICQFMIHFELIFVTGVRSASRFLFFFFARGYLVVLKPFGENASFLPRIAFAPLQKIGRSYVRVLRVPRHGLSTYLSVLWPVPPLTIVALR